MSTCWLLERDDMGDVMKEAIIIHNMTEESRRMAYHSELRG